MFCIWHQGWNMFTRWSIENDISSIDQLWINNISQSSENPKYGIRHTQSHKWNKIQTYYSVCCVKRLCRGPVLPNFLRDGIILSWVYTMFGQEKFQHWELYSFNILLTDCIIYGSTSLARGVDFRYCDYWREGKRSRLV